MAMDERINRQNFIEWLEQQDPNEAYNYSDNCCCALGQWLADIGYPQRSVGGHIVWLRPNSKEKFNIGETLGMDVEEYLNTSKPHTFGELLKNIETDPDGVRT